MKRYRNILLIAAATLLLSSCILMYDYNDYTVRGYLYSDSTKAEPLADAELVFYRGSKLVGTAKTDGTGFWGLWYKYTPETSHDLYPHESKFQLAEWEMVIKYNEDTLFCQLEHYFPQQDTLVLYPGIDWRHYYDY